MEDYVNYVIAANVEVTEEFITQTEAKERFDLTHLHDNASETVRVVRIGDYDQCLCEGSCQTHL